HRRHHRRRPPDPDRPLTRPAAHPAPRTSPHARPRNGMKPRIHGVRTHWNRASMASGAAERMAVAEAFGVPVIDMFVSTEGLVGHSEPGGTVLTFASDTCIAECTDDEGRPVPDGVASARVLVTNLHNLTQPIIRYELTDRFTPAGTSPGGAL